MLFIDQPKKESAREKKTARWKNCNKSTQYSKHSTRSASRRSLLTAAPHSRLTPIEVADDDDDGGFSRAITAIISVYFYFTFFYSYIFSKFLSWPDWGPHSCFSQFRFLPLFFQLILPKVLLR